MRAYRYLTIGLTFCVFMLIIAQVPAFAQKPKLVVQIGHFGPVLSVAFSPDGKYALSAGSYDRIIKLWDIATGKEVRTFQGHSDYINSVAFSPEMKYALSGSNDKTLKLWDIATGKEVRTFQGHSASVHSVAFSPDEKYALSGSIDKTLKLWDIETGKEFKTLHGHSDSVHSVAFSPDGKHALSGSYDNTLKLWDIETGKEVRTFQGHEGYVVSVAFSSDRKYAISGSSDKTLKLWDIATGREVRTFQGHSDSVNSVAFSPDGKYALSGSLDKTLRLWDIAAGKELRIFQGHSERVFSVAFSSNGKYVLSGSMDKSLKLWDIATGREIRTFQGYSGSVLSVAFSPDRKYAISGSEDKTLKLWDIATGKEIRTFQGHSGKVLSVAFSSDGKYAISGSSDKTLKLWDIATGKEVRTFHGHEAEVCSVIFSPDGRHVLSGSCDKTLKLWDIVVGKEVRTFRGHYGGIWEIAFSPDGKYAISAGSNDWTLKLWDIATGKEIRTFQGHSSWVSSVAFSPDGKYALSGSCDKTLKLWDIATGKEIRTFQGHSGYVDHVTVSPNGKYVLSKSDDNTMRLWDIATGKEIRTFQGHSGGISSVTFSPDGKNALSGSSDCTMKIWNISTGKELCSLISLDKNDWAVVTPEGLFDASPGGMMMMHWVVGLEVIDLDQLKERYYEPGLLQKIMGYNHEPLRSASAFNYVKLYPEVTVSPLPQGKRSLTLNLRNRGGGIGKVQIFVNNKEIVADARGPKPDKDAKEAKLAIDLTNAPFIPKKENKIRIVTWNDEGYLSSRGLQLSYIPPGESISEPPHLWAIVGGVSEYEGKDLTLKYAAKDAEDMAQAFSLGAKRLFGADKVHLTLLSTSNAPGALQPTKENFRKAFENARKSKPEDILMIYLAGHGISMKKDSDVYCYLTKEARASSTAALADPEVLRSTTITSDELMDWIRTIDATHKVLILDTCAAGDIAAKLTEKRDVPSDQIRAIDRLKDNSGFYVLMGCASNAVSYEATMYGQGVLTYTLLQGMKGAALRDNEYVEVSPLFDYAVQHVPDFAKDIGGIQNPRVIAPYDSSGRRIPASFPLGRLEKSDKESIPLQAAKPLILRPMLLDIDKLSDDLNLTIAVGKGLNNESYTSPRSNERASVVYVDSSELPGAIRPSGVYTVKGSQVKVTMKLVREGKELKFEMEGSKSDLEGLVKKLVKEIILRSAGM